MKNEFVITRGKNSGIHCGIFLEKNELGIILKNARRIWRWKGANSLNELAAKGADRLHTRISEPVEKIALSDDDVCEILICKEEAKKNLSESRWG